MLFDLVNDPDENENTVDKSKNQSIIAEMTELLRNHMVNRNSISLP